jgi:hypothetical protein
MYLVLGLDEYLQLIYCVVNSETIHPYHTVMLDLVISSKAAHELIIETLISVILSFYMKLYTLFESLFVGVLCQP